MKTGNDIYIHIGLAKTGTTTLQKHLFVNHSRIHYLGKFFRHGFVSDVWKIIKGKRMVSRMEMKFGKDDIHLQSLEDQLEYASRNNLKIVLSKEGLSGTNESNKKETAKAFFEYFGNCKIILFVREPESFIKSQYTQLLKAFQTRPPIVRPKWMSLLAEEPPHYFDINQWLDVSWQSSASPKNSLSYADTADIYADVMGKENVKIFIYEEFVRNPKGLIDKLCDFMGIDAEEAFSLIDGRRENTRHTIGYIERLKEIENSPALSQEFRSSGMMKRDKMLAPDEGQGAKIIPILTEEWHEKIHALGKEQNRRMVTEWGLPLADYGYRF